MGSARAVTIINRFTVSGDHAPELVERELVRTAEVLRRQPDCDFFVRARLRERRDVYVQLGYWRVHEAFVSAVRQQPFTAQLERIGPMVVDAEADQAVSAMRVVAPCPGPSDAFGLLTEYLVTGDHDAFVAAAEEQARVCLAWPGFGGYDLLRSTLRPRRYVGISWWRDGDDCAAATCAAAQREPARTVTDAATVRVERTCRISYELPLSGD